MTAAKDSQGVRTFSNPDGMPDYIQLQGKLIGLWEKAKPTPSWIQPPKIVGNRKQRRAERSKQRRKS